MARITHDEAALLRTICANPDDDLPRLVYADWLEEHNRGKRAEFIRLQIASDEHLRRHLVAARNTRINELFNELRQELYRELPKWARIDANWQIRLERFSRGFLTQLFTFASPFIQYGPQLLDRVPFQTLRLDYANKLLPQLANCPWLARILDLELSCTNLQTDGLIAFVESDYVKSLQALNLEYSSVNDIGLQAIANSRSLANLKRLNLRSNRISIGGVKKLARSPFLQCVERIDLRRNNQLYGHEYRIEDWFGPRVVIRDDDDDTYPN